ncbi:hypothetical protein NX059_010730 [Plenodomus lindquistii]|nr:hypothetical protein NX059_010730 [Plenodomus lindquistii]
MSRFSVHSTDRRHLHPGPDCTIRTGIGLSADCAKSSHVAVAWCEEGRSGYGNRRRSTQATLAPRFESHSAARQWTCERFGAGSSSLDILTVRLVMILGQWASLYLHYIDYGTRIKSSPKRL